MSKNSALDPQTAAVNYGRSQTSSPPKFKVKVRLWQHKVGRPMETRRAHLFIIFLIVVDVGCIIADLAYRLLSQRCGDGWGHHDLTWVDVLSHISLGISATFLIGIILALFSFGLRYYNPFGGIPLASLHLFDAMVIITSLVLELTLRGREAELASLLILLRHWRIVTLVEGQSHISLIWLVYVLMKWIYGCCPCQWCKCSGARRNKSRTCQRKTGASKASVVPSTPYH